MSSLAQVSAVIFNDKISPEQKTFLIPQEIADAAINILSFYAITSSFKNVASKLVSTGKITTKPVKDFLTKNGVNSNEHIGKLGFNIENMANFSDIKDEYKSFKNGVAVSYTHLDKNLFTEKLLNEFFKNYEEFLKQGFLMIKKEYIERCNFLGKEISVKVFNDKKSGIAKTINDNGELVIEKNNDEFILTMGDIL